MATLVSGVLAARAAKAPAIPPPRTSVSMGRVAGMGALQRSVEIDLGRVVDPGETKAEKTEELGAIALDIR